MMSKVTLLACTVWILNFAWSTGIALHVESEVDKAQWGHLPPPSPQWEQQQQQAYLAPQQTGPLQATQQSTGQVESEFDKAHLPPPSPQWEQQQPPAYLAPQQPGPLQATQQSTSQVESEAGLAHKRTSSLTRKPYVRAVEPRSNLKRADMMRLERPHGTVKLVVASTGQIETELDAAHKTSLLMQQSLDQVESDAGAAHKTTSSFTRKNLPSGTFDAVVGSNGFQFAAPVDSEALLRLDDADDLLGVSVNLDNAPSMPEVPMAAVVPSSNPKRAEMMRLERPRGTVKVETAHQTNILMQQSPGQAESEVQASHKRSSLLTRKAKSTDGIHGKKLPSGTFDAILGSNVFQSSAPVDSEALVGADDPDSVLDVASDFQQVPAAAAVAPAAVTPAAPSTAASGQAQGLQRKSVTFSVWLASTVFVAMCLTCFFKFDYVRQLLAGQAPRRASGGTSAATASRERADTNMSMQSAPSLRSNDSRVLSMSHTRSSESRKRDAEIKRHTSRANVTLKSSMRAAATASRLRVEKKMQLRKSSAESETIQEEGFQHLGCSVAFLEEFCISAMADGKGSSSSQPHTGTSPNTKSKLTFRTLLDEVILPETASEHCSYAQWLEESSRIDPKGNPAFAKATHFVMEQWEDRPIQELLDVLLLWLADGSAPSTSVYLWLDVFSHNHHRPLEHPQKITEYRKVIAETGNTVLVLDTWNKPKCLTQLWVVWQLCCSFHEGAKLHFAMKGEGRHDFVLEVLKSLDNVQTGISKIDVSSSVGSSQKETDYVHTHIQATLDFWSLNSRLRHEMVSWLANVVVRDRLKELKAESARVTIQENVGRLLREWGNLDEALSYFEGLMSEIVAKHGSDSEVALTVSHQIALTLQALGKTEDATDRFRDCLAKREQLMDPREEETLECAYDLAVLLSNEKPLPPSCFKEARTLFSRAIAGRESSLGAEDPKTLIAVSNMARLLSRAPEPSIDLFADAEKLHEHAKYKLTNQLRSKHPLTLTATHNQACHFGNYGAWLQGKDGKEALAGRFLNATSNQLKEKERERAMAGPKYVAKAVKQLGDVHTVRVQILGKNNVDTLATEAEMKRMMLIESGWSSLK